MQVQRQAGIYNLQKRQNGRPHRQVVPRDPGRQKLVAERGPRTAGRRMQNSSRTQAGRWQAGTPTQQVPAPSGGRHSRTGGRQAGILHPETGNGMVEQRRKIYGKIPERQAGGRTQAAAPRQKRQQ